MITYFLKKIVEISFWIFSIIIICKSSKNPTFVQSEKCHPDRNFWIKKEDIR